MQFVFSHVKFIINILTTALNLYINSKIKIFDGGF